MAYPYVQAALHGGTGNIPASRIVIHATVSPCVSGGARSVADYFRTTTRPASAHYVVDPGEIVQCLRDDVIGYHAPPNTGSLGVELCDMQAGAGSRWADTDHEAMLVRAAGLVRDLAAKYGIPLVRLSSADLLAGKRGICGHVDVTGAWHRTTHVDPGPDFPWAHFMALVTTNPQEADVPLTDAEIDKIATAAAAKVWRTVLTNSHNKIAAQAAAWLVYGNEKSGQAASEAVAAKAAALGVQATVAQVAADAVRKAIADGAQLDVNVSVNGKVQP